MLDPVEIIPAPQPASTSGYISFEEYVEHSSETRICEWIDGEVITMPGASFEHQTLFAFLLNVVGLYVERNNLGQIIPAPFIMKLEQQRRGREPDILFVGRDRQNLLTKNYLDGAADLAIEIVSPESITRDRGEKYVEYEAAGIREYWLIDPDRKQAEFYALRTDGFYHLATVSDGVFRSEVLDGFFLRLEWLWQKPLPTIAALQELALLG